MTTFKPSRFSLVALLWIAFISPSTDASPYPGSIYREYQDHSFNKPRPMPVFPEQDELNAYEDRNDEAVFVNHFEVYGNTHLSPERVKEALTSYTNREVSAGELHKIATDLMATYREEGLFAARVYLPPQSIINGVVKVYIYEGILEAGGVAMTNSGQRVNDQVVHAILESNLQTNTVIDARSIERSILLIDDLPGLTSHATLYPGEEVGTARFLLQTEDTPLITGNIDFDNFGSYYTGKNRVGTTVYINSPSKRGDQITFRAASSGSDSNYGFASYSLPIYGNGFRLGLSYDYLDYQLGKEFKPLGSKGNASEMRVFASYPFIRGRHLNVLGRVDASHIELEDKNDNGLQAKRSIDSGIFSINGDHDDDWLANGTTYYGAALTVGSVDIDGNAAFTDFDRINPKTAGRFTRMTYSLSRLQHLVGNLSTHWAISGQWAGENLDSSQKFYIGGPFTVAGYPTGEASGDEGTLLQADLRYDFYQMPWRGNLQISAFYSRGDVKLFHDPWSGWELGNPIIKNRFTLESAGLAFNQAWQQGFVLRGMLGRQLGSNAGRNPVTEQDSDKSSGDYRAWIQGIYYF